MSKLKGYLNYKDWCILKHSLRDKVKSKEDMLHMDTLITSNNIPSDKRKALEKELKEEKKTLERVTKLVGGFKLYVHGEKRHYNSDPYYIGGDSVE